MTEKNECYRLSHRDKEGRPKECTEHKPRGSPLGLLEQYADFLQPCPTFPHQVISYETFQGRSINLFSNEEVIST
ncbi:MAG: hypothetical protein D3910_09190 [Candidatus Electrothrix sp. ATG2]|nr:hypothetical protein [Candidatus Electrothrix sp. ATG2]